MNQNENRREKEYASDIVDAIPENQINNEEIVEQNNEKKYTLSEIIGAIIKYAF